MNEILIELKKKRTLLKTHYASIETIKKQIMELQMQIRG
jgi:hypothetical protein